MLYSAVLAWLYWDPERVVFVVPYINHPVVWYGLLFVFGFIVAYFLIIPMFQQCLEKNTTLRDKGVKLRDVCQLLVDRLMWFIVGGTIIGARLGHVFFYEWPRFRAYPLDIIKVWEGGLASHGGSIGVITAIFLYQRTVRRRYPELTFIRLLDLVAVPTAFVGFCIRLGNFVNQEILGTESTLPWAVIFGHPADRSAPVPRHPAQLYEAVFYLITFVILYSLWRVKRDKVSPGFFSGLFFILVFGSRFFVEFWKMPQSLMIDESFLQTGQLLSIPFIVLGILLMTLGKKWNDRELEEKATDVDRRQKTEYRRQKIEDRR